MSKRTKKKLQKETNVGYFQNYFEEESELLEIPFFSEENRKAIITKIIVIVGGLLFIFILAKIGILENLKLIVLSYFYDYISYERIKNLAYSRGSLDIGVVLSGLWLIAGLSWINYTLGISFICLLRCWLDGYTYPTDNSYFVWGIVIVGIFCLFNTLSKKESFYINTPIIALFLFIILAVLTMPFSYQIGRSYRLLILWVSYLLMLILAYNASFHIWSSKFLVWALLITLGFQSWYAFLHFHYVLPFLRKSLMLDPSLRIKFFGTAELSKELIYRFNMNRAFGTMLFPNALAGFIILVLPLCFGKLINEIKFFLKVIKLPKTELNKGEEKKLIFFTAGIWLLAVALLFATQLFPLTYTLETENSIDFILAGAISILLALVPSGFFVWLSITKGYEVGKSFVRLGTLIFCFFFGVTSLWLTYSRGAWLSLILSGITLVIVRIVVNIKRICEDKNYKKTFIFITLVTLFILAIVFIYPEAMAQSSSDEHHNVTSKATNIEATPSTQILEEGVEVSWEHLRDPSSFRLRWSYWKVGLSMFIHNLITGVGLGNFGLAYPKYQYLGAGDVKECHNGYLQILCETGILGGGMFILFIGFIITRIIKEFTSEFRFERLCLNIGILAFLIHSGLDIHFSHPSLVTYLMITLGIYLSQIMSKGNYQNYVEENNTPKSKLKKYTLIIFTMILTILTIATFLPYFRDLVRSKMSFINVGKDNDLQLIMKTANFMFSDVLDFALGKSDKQPKVSGTILRHFYLDLNNIRNLGSVYVPKGDGSNKAVLLPENEPVPENCILVIKEPWKFLHTMKIRILKYAKTFEKIDAIFPLQDDMPNYLGELYKSIYIHSSYVHEPSITEETREGMLYWCKETLMRSPYHGDSYYNYGKALWYAGVKDDCPSVEKKKEYILESLKHLETSAKYWKNVPFYWYEYIAHLKDAKKIFEEMGEHSWVNDIEKKIVKNNEYVDNLVRRRRELGI